MNISPLITDNITEILVKIIKFTDTRHEILTMNLDNSHSNGYIPKDLDVEGFSESVDSAVTEHALNNRLIFRDSDSIKFGVDGDFQVCALTDHESWVMIKEDKSKYLETQINKMLENTLNRKLAKELLKQKHSATAIFE